MRLGVLISGRGSNLQALIDACKDPSYPAEIALVVSNRADAAGLDRAREAGIETATIDHKAYAERVEFDREITAQLESAGVELVCLAGFMRLLSEAFVDRWRDRLINIHPSLLPAFKGLNVHDRVLQTGVRITGCSVHYVRSEMDSGPVIVQAAVPVAENDTADTLAARILVQEHRIYPMAVRLIAEGRARIVGERVRVGLEVVGDASLTNPNIEP